jgi:hypothetical protein
MSDEFLTPAEVERDYKVRRNWLAKRRMRGDGPVYIKVAGKVLYRRRDIDGWLAAAERASTGAA